MNFAVVVPMYKQSISADEEISLKHLRHFLGDYDKYLIKPESLTVDYPDFGIKSFQNVSFRSVAAYSKLMLSREFYEAFRDYEYILVYQLDCLVFSDQLKGWCRTGLDYIGAPWLNSPADPSQGFSRVGNGGLSLRKVSSFLRVIDSAKPSKPPLFPLKDIYSSPLEDSRNLSGLKRQLKKLRVIREVRKGAAWYMSNYTVNEDHFWSDRARIFYPEFRVAPIETALGFAFERAPRFCFEQNNERLPFGCHAWQRYDRSFWEPYLLK